MSSCGRRVALRDARCLYCIRYPERSCPLCATLRRRAVEFVEVGLDVEAIAGELRIGRDRVVILLTQARIARECRGLERDRVPVKAVRDVFVRWRAQDPRRHCLQELSRRTGYSCSSAVARLLGLKPTSGFRRGGVFHPGTRATMIDVRHAGVLVRAMGYAPSDFEWL